MLRTYTTTTNEQANIRIFTNIGEDGWWLVFLFIDDEGVQRLDEIGIRLRRWIGVFSPFTYCVTHECRLTSSNWKNDKKNISKRAFRAQKEILEMNFYDFFFWFLRMMFTVNRLLGSTSIIPRNNCWQSAGTKCGIWKIPFFTFSSNWRRLSSSNGNAP